MNNQEQLNYNPQMNNNQELNVNQLMNNIPNINNRNNNVNMNALPDIGVMRNANENQPNNANPTLQTLLNNLNDKNNAKNTMAMDTTNKDETPLRYILKHFNFVLVVVIALAWSDVAKFYINKSNNIW